MDDHILSIIELVLLILTFASAIFAIIRIFRKSIPMYFQLIVCAVSCNALAYLYNFLINLVMNDGNGWMYLGDWGNLGMQIFFLAANFGQFDSIIDGNNEKFKKQRRLAFIAPAVLLAIRIPALLNLNAFVLNEKILLVIVTVIVMLASYFCLKMILIRDPEDIFLEGVKPANACALLYFLTDQIYLLSTMYELKTLKIILGYCLYIILIAIPLAADWGSRKWKTL